MLAGPGFGVLGEDTGDALPSHERTGERDLGFFDRIAAFETEKQDVPALVVRLAECSAPIVGAGFIHFDASVEDGDEDIGVVPDLQRFRRRPAFSAAHGRRAPSPLDRGVFALQGFRFCCW